MWHEKEVMRLPNVGKPVCHIPPVLPPTPSVKVALFHAGIQACSLVSGVPHLNSNEGVSGGKHWVLAKLKRRNVIQEVLKNQNLY